MIRPELRRLCGRDGSLEFPVRLGTGALTGPWCNCLCGREVPSFARVPNQKSGCGKKNGSQSA